MGPSPTSSAKGRETSRPSRFSRRISSLHRFIVVICNAILRRAWGAAVLGIYAWPDSSAGQSNALVMRRSSVRIRLGPPLDDYKIVRRSDEAMCPGHFGCIVELNRGLCGFHPVA